MSARVRRAGAALLGLALGLAAAPARADPEPGVDVTRCTLFELAEARRAIAAELTVPSDLRDRLVDVRIVIECPDAITARISVEPAPDDGPLEKLLDLGDLPGDLRLRLVALAVAELVDVAVTVAAPATDAPTSDPPPGPKRPTGEGGLDARPFESAAPDTAPPSSMAAAPLRVDRLARPALRRRRALSGGEAGARQVGLLAGVRVFVERPEPMAEIAVELTAGPFGVDLFGATGTSDDSLGDLRMLIAGAGASARLGCRGGDGTWLCASVRGAAGVAGVRADPVHPMIESHDLYAPYLELGPRLEVRVESPRWSASLLLGTGWSSGVIALAEDREVVRLAGPFVTLSLGVGWPR